jgi:hypothetical protein
MALDFVINSISAPSPAVPSVVFYVTSYVPQRHRCFCICLRYRSYTSEHSICDDVFGRCRSCAISAICAVFAIVGVLCIGQPACLADSMRFVAVVQLLSSLPVLLPSERSYFCYCAAFAIVGVLCIGQPACLADSMRFVAVVQLLSSLPVLLPSERLYCCSAWQKVRGLDFSPRLASAWPSSHSSHSAASPSVVLVVCPGRPRNPSPHSLLRSHCDGGWVDVLYALCLSFQWMMIGVLHWQLLQ